MQNTNILLVEDELAHVKLIKRAFKSSSMDVNLIIANRLDEARIVIEDEVIDIMITDFMLPDGEGLELLPGHGSESVYPIILMTSFGNEEIAVKALKLGAFDYIVKSQEILRDMPHIAKRALREWTQRNELKTTRNALRRSQEELEYIVKNIPDIVYQLDGKSNITFINDAIKQYGYSVEELIGKSVFDLVPPVDHEKTKYRVNERRRGNRRTRFFEVSILSKDKTAVPFEVQNLSPVFLLDAQGIKLSEEDSVDSIWGTIGIAKDITPRKQIETALRESEEKYRDLVENIPEAVFSLDIDKKVEYISPAVESILGHKTVDLIGKKLSDFTLPDSKNLFDLSFGKVDESNQKPSEFEFLSSDGAVRWLRISCKPVMINTEILGYNGIMSDITGRKKIENALQLSEKKLDSIVKSVPDIIYRLDNDGKIIFINKAIEKYGYKTDDLIGKDVFEFIHPEDRKELKYRINERRTRSRKTELVEMRLVTKDSKSVSFEFRWQDMEIEPVFLLQAEGMYDGEISSQNFIGTQGIAVDISERKRAEQAIYESEKKYRYLFRNLYDPAILVNKKTGYVVDANLSAETLLGYSRDKLIGMPHSSLYPDNGNIEYVKSLYDENAGEFSKKVDASIVKYDGTTLPAEAYSQIIHLGGEEMIFEYYHDLTQQKQLEEERGKAAKLESIGLLAGGIAHDFNNFLTSILGNLSLAEIYSDSDAITSKDLMKEAEKACLHARDLTQQLLTFSRGGDPVKKVTIISDLITESATFALRGSNVKCNFSIPPDLWLAEIDEGQINQVLNNIVINSKQAMPEGGEIFVKAENVTINEIGPLGLDPGLYVSISIADQGMGIPSSYLSKVFDPYFSTKHEGHGLGLSTSHSIVKKHNGRIHVESEIDNGSIFHIYLPAILEERHPVADTPIMQGEMSYNILLMDDDVSVRNMAARMLSHFGNTVTTVPDGADVIEDYRSALDSGSPYDMVILDLTVPGGMGGLETLKELKMIDPDVRAIVSSGYSNDPVVSNYSSYGFKGVVPKPYTWDDLMKVLHDLGKAG